MQDNKDYANEYISAVNNNLQNGYVPLQRILYFYLEDKSIDINNLYTLNQNSLYKTTKEIDVVCEDVRLKNYNACDNTSKITNKDYLVVSTARFNFPLNNSFKVTSFYNQQRIIYGEENVHSGWDFATKEQTPVYSVCDGIIERVNFTQFENVAYDISNNRIGNSITIKCDRDYEEIYYVVFHHLYPNSSKVNVGDRVNHWTEIASVGTTGYSTGNHLHYQVYNSNWKLIDGMQLIDLNLIKPDI